MTYAVLTGEVDRRTDLGDCEEWSGSEMRSWKNTDANTSHEHTADRAAIFKTRLDWLLRVRNHSCGFQRDVTKPYDARIAFLKTHKTGGRHIGNPLTCRGRTYNTLEQAIH